MEESNPGLTSRRDMGGHMFLLHYIFTNRWIAKVEYRSNCWKSWKINEGNVIRPFMLEKVSWVGPNEIVLTWFWRCWGKIISMNCNEFFKTSPMLTIHFNVVFGPTQQRPCMSTYFAFLNVSVSMYALFAKKGRTEDVTFSQFWNVLGTVI